MTAQDFRNEHGDPTTWTVADIEEQQHYAEIEALPAEQPPTTPQPTDLAA